jgi:hypothetical protein
LDVANGTKDKSLPVEARALPTDQAVRPATAGTEAAEPPHGRQVEIEAASMTAPQDPHASPLAPPGWERETPRYRAIRDIQPATKARFRFEPPFANLANSDEWQYGTRPIKAGEIIETPEWPHSSFRPLNYSAGKVLDFFNTQQKSRLPRSPWRGDRIVLVNGLTGATQPTISIDRGMTAA